MDTDQKRHAENLQLRINRARQSVEFHGENNNSYPAREARRKLATAKAALTRYCNRITKINEGRK